MPRWFKATLAVSLVGIAVALYLYGANIQSRLVNTDAAGNDQGDYMDMAENYARSHYTWMIPRNRMPLYPLMLTLIYRENMPEAEFFARSKEFSVLLSLVLLAALYPIFGRYLALHSAINLLLVVAFSVFVFRASYVQSELLFCSLSFAGFWLLSRILVGPAWKVGIAAGMVLGLAYLTKGSVLAGLVLSVGCVALCGAATVCTAFKHRAQELKAWRSYRRLALSAMLCVIFFLAAISHYSINSKRVYGSFLYNVNTTYYMWYDSWDQAKEGTRAHGDRSGLPNMPPDEIPSLRKYLREHKPVQMLEREWQGLQTTIRRHTYKSYGYAKYVVLYALLALGLCGLTGRSTMATVRKHRYLLLFWVAWPLLYVALYSWYAPISAGRRFLLAQFVPFMFTMAYVVERQGAELRLLLISGRRVKVGSLLNGLITVLLVTDIYWNLAYRLAHVGGGN